MKKLLIVLMSMLVLVGCSTAPKEETNSDGAVEMDKKETQETTEVKQETMIYASETGDIEVPADPQRIVILDSFAAGALLKFDGSVVGHEQWTGTNPLFAEYLKDSTEIAADNLEQIIALSPDLIVVSATNENIKELSEIAPTVSFTYGKLSYLDAIVEYGKLVNKEDEALRWVEEFKAEAVKVGEAIKSKYGEGVTVSVFEAFGDQLYLYGDNWGRGTQILYQEMGLTMTEEVKEVALKDGYYSISAEVIPDYSAELMVLSYFKDSNMAFMDTETWKNIDAVKNNKVLQAEAEKFYMTGPITLEYQLEQIEGKFAK